jgi:ATP-dependent protease ClpP protease subunit
MRAAEATTTPLELGEVERDAVLPLVEQLVIAQEAHIPFVRIRINSPGGSVGIGLGLSGVIQDVRRSGTKVICVVDGKAASMAAYILQACSVRAMTPQSSIMFHEPSISADGNQWGLLEVVQRLGEVNQRMAIFIAGRLKISLAEYKKRIRNRDWWLGKDEALAVGAVDVVLPLEPTPDLAAQ